MRVAVVTGLAALLLGAAPTAEAAGQHRLPKGYHWGRCLLVVDGRTLISGRCAYEFRGKGGFYVAGPRQIYEGIDFRNPDGSGAGDQSRDYWAWIFKDEDGNWTGYGNDFVNATHGDRTYGTLVQKGACFVHDGLPSESSPAGPVRVCLWRK